MAMAEACRSREMPVRPKTLKIGLEAAAGGGHSTGRVDRVGRMPLASQDDGGFVGSVADRVEYRPEAPGRCVDASDPRLGEACGGHRRAVLERLVVNPAHAVHLGGPSLRAVLVLGEERGRGPGRAGELVLRDPHDFAGPGKSLATVKERRPGEWPSSPTAFPPAASMAPS